MAQFNKTLSNNSQYRLELVVNQGSQSTSNNTSNVSWTLRVRKLSGSGYWANGTFNWSVNIGGIPRSGSISGYDFRNYTLLTLGSGTVSITHNPDGKKSINVSGKWTADSTLGSATASGKLDLKTIPRYLTIRSLSPSNITHNSARISWGTDRRANRVEYRIGSGSWKLGGTYDATSGAFTATGLTPNASNSLTVRTRAKDSGLWTSKSLTVRTLGPATISSMTASNIWPHKFTMNFSVNQTLESAQWRVNGGSWKQLSSTARTFQVTGLSPDTSNKVELQVQSNSQTTTRAVDIKTAPLATATLPSGRDTTERWDVTINKTPSELQTEFRIVTGTGETVAGWSTKSTAVNRYYTITEARNNIIYDAYPNTSAARVAVEVRSYDGDTLLGTTKTALIPHTITLPLPQVEVGAIRDTDTLTTSITGDNSVLVATKSRIQVGYTGAKGGRGTTNRLKVTVRAGAYSASADTTTASGNLILGAIPNTGNVTISVEVEDSRGLKNTATTTVSVLPYTPPTLVTFTPERENQYEQPSYLISEVNIASIPVDRVEKNKVKSIRYRVRELPEGTWGSWANSSHTAKSGGRDLQLIETNTFMSNYPNNKEYQVEMELTDSFNEKRSWTSVLPKGIAMLSFEEGDRIRAGVVLSADEGITLPPASSWSPKPSSHGNLYYNPDRGGLRFNDKGTWRTLSMDNHKHDASDITSGVIDQARLDELPFIEQLNSNPSPSQIPAGITHRIMSNQSIGIQYEEFHSAVQTWRPAGTGNDFSKGPVRQVALTEKGNIYTRTGNARGWTAWESMVTRAEVDALKKRDHVVDFTNKCTSISAVTDLRAVAFGRVVDISFRFRITKANDWFKDIVTIPTEYQSPRDVLAGTAAHYYSADIGMGITAIINNRNQVWVRANTTSANVVDFHFTYVLN